MTDNKTRVVENPDGLMSRFADFLVEYYPDEVRDFAEQYPGSYSFPIEWSDLESFDVELAMKIEKNPNELQSVIDDALRYHDLHDAAYLNYSTIVFAEPPDWKYPSEAQKSHRGVLTGLKARVSEASEPETMLREAVFECRDCETQTIQIQDGDELVEPYECSGCGKKRVEYDLQMEQSTTESYQELVVQDPGSLKSGGHNVTMDVEIIGDATGTLAVGDWALFTGQVKYRLVGDTTEVEPYFEATYATVTVPENAVIEDSEYPSPIEEAFIATADVELTEAHLTGFTQHAENVVEECSPWDMNEEEGKLKFITPLLELLGWDLYGDEVRMEYSTYVGDADYVVAVGEEPVICIEAKSPGDLQPSDFEQLRDYMLTLEVEWGLLTDGITYQIVRNNRTKSNPTIIVDAEYRVLAEYYDEFTNITRDAIVD